MSESRNVTVVRSLMDAFERGDMEGQLALLDPGIEMVEWPKGPDQRTYRGHEGAIQAWENVCTLRDGNITRIEFFTTKEPALRAAGLDKPATSEEAA